MTDFQPTPSSRRKSLDLFEAGRQKAQERDQPLAARLRPRTLDEFVGQDHILGPGRLLRRAIQADQISSLIFYGPPGTGKTTLAAVIANTTKSHFISINAVLAGVKDIRNAVDEAQERSTLHGHRTILFIDEVHRFNKAQQDALLPWVENGTVILIGATTENPYFSVNRPLVSRSRIFQLRELEAEDLRRIAAQALRDRRGYAELDIEMDEEALEHLVDVCNGDARGMLNALELAVETTSAVDGVVHVSLEVAEESIQQRAVLYDKEGDYHFDTISAFIKSLRGSDPDASVYWLAKMVYAGEDPNYILRRMLIFAGEDVGLADPAALQVVAAAAETFDRVGLPEGRFHLAEAALYLATAPKSNSTFAFFDALSAVESEADSEVPNPLKDASRDSEGLGHGANYLYPHAYRDHWVAQQYLPNTLHGRVFYQPSDQGHEAAIGDLVRRRRELQLAAVVEGSDRAEETLQGTGVDKDREQWLVRAAGDVSGQFDSIRGQIFDGLALERHHVVLDLNARSGLLTWEAMRRVPEGSVWSLCRDATTSVALHEMAAHHLPQIDRPVVIEGPLDKVPELVAFRDQEQRFDAIIGHNAMVTSGAPTVFAELSKVAAGGGHLRLAEVTSHKAQRLAKLIDLERLEGDLGIRLVELEEAIYADRENPRFRWDLHELQAQLSSAGLTGVEGYEKSYTKRRTIDEAQIAQWFHPGGEQEKTFAGHLKEELEDCEVAAVRRLFERTVQGREVLWQTTYAFVEARFPAGTQTSPIELT
ncbi:MAG: AAA family ATPase [Candidatus Latescibacterota bacterium]|nr:AAA family ATPase [Candidatus Latescibacterota bacterium]